MMDIELSARKNLARLIQIDIDDINFDLNISEDYSLSSLNLVILITNICEDTDIPVFSFTDSDIANLRTLRDVVTMFATAANQDA